MLHGPLVSPCLFSGAPVRFIADGPDIPDALIVAQEEGRVLFICGAGVSMAQGVPGFRGLVEKIYAALNENPDDHIADKALVDKGDQWDRVLRQLERRLTAPGLRQADGMRARMREVVRKALAPPEDIDLSNHAALIRLSRDSEGRLRLATTNFDPLFEQAWPGEGRAPSHAGPAMPQPKAAGCEGILHLHGRLAYGDLPETDLVLTSAEFGDAYLRSGWASRYVYDLVRAYTVVLVGYGADDPPMRYLLEVLEADRERYADLQPVYAFADCEPETAGLCEALWRAKGVEPILHGLRDGTFSPLYDTLRSWADYSENPSLWRREALRPFLARRPSDLEKEEMARVVHLLSRGDAGAQLAALSPSADWLPALLEQGVLARDGSGLEAWISSRLNDPDMITACAGLRTVGERLQWYVESELDRSAEMPTHRQEAWTLLLSLGPSIPREHDMTWHRLKGRLRRGAAGYDARRTIAALLRPRVSVRRPWRLYEPEPDEPETLSSLLSIEFTSGDLPPLGEFLAAWPQDAQRETQLLTTLNQTLMDALDQEADLRSGTGWNHADRDVPSVAHHGQNAHRSGFYPLVRVIADLWLRLAGRDPAAAAIVLNQWRASSWILTRRLALFADHQEMTPPADAVADIIALDDFDFWVSNAQAEVMKILVDRWDYLPRAPRAAIERRIVDGMPRSLFPKRPIADEEWDSIHDAASYRRLTRLRTAGRALSRRALARLSKIERRYPLWRPGPGDRDDFHSWSESSSGPQGEPKSLDTVADDRLVAEALRIQQDHAWDQGDVWRLFCQSDPARAFRGLATEAAEGRYRIDAWPPFLWSLRDRPDDALLAQAADLLLAAPDQALLDLADTVASVLQTERVRLAGRYWPFWDRLAQVVYGTHAPSLDPGDSDLSTRALNQSGGVLVWTLLEALSAERPQAGQGLPAPYEARIETALADEGEAGRLARIRSVNSLTFLHNIAPDWAERRLTPYLDTASADAAVYWAAQIYDHMGSARLFNHLRPHLLTYLRRPDLSHMEAEQLGGRAFQVVVWLQAGNARDYELDPTEFRRVLTASSEELRNTVSWMLWRLTDRDEDDEARRSDRWSSLVGPVFRTLWPLEGAAQSERSSENLMRMALEAGPEFPDAVDAIASIIVPFRLWDVRYSLRLEDRHQELDRLYPRPFLRLLNALVDPARHPPPQDLGETLARCRDADPGVVHEASYRRLLAISQAMSA